MSTRLNEIAAAELGVAEAVDLVVGDAAAYPADPGAFDIAACLGAAWIGDGLVGTAALLRPALRAGGVLLSATSTGPSRRPRKRWWPSADWSRR